MLNRKSFLVCWIGTFLLIPSACIPIQAVTKLPKTISSTNKPIAIKTTIVLIAESTVTPTLAPTATKTLTPMSTLSKEDAFALLTDSLRNNDGCQLPCWWGLIPGKSTHADVYKKLVVFNTIDSGGFLNMLDPLSGEVNLDYTKDDLFIGIDISTKPGADKNTLQMINISTQALYLAGNSSNHAYGVSVYTELLRSYSLSKVLSTYGTPSQVLVRVEKYDHIATPLEQFDITLLYPERGIFVMYEARGERKGDKMGGCPSKAFVELWLLSPDDKNSYQKVLSANDGNWRDKFSSSKSLEDATSMTIEQFYETFKEPSNLCLQTPLGIWPDSS